MYPKIDCNFLKRLNNCFQFRNVFKRCTKITFDGVRNVFAIDMNGHQSSWIITDFPFVVDEALQLDFGAAMRVLADASDDRYVRPIRFEAVFFLVGLENTANTHRNIKHKSR